MLSYFLAGSTIGPVVSQSLLDFMIFLIFLCFAVHTVKLRFKNITVLRKPYTFEYGFIFYFLAVVVGLLFLRVTDLEPWERLYRFSWIVNFYIFAWAFSHTEIELNKVIKFFIWAFIIPNAYALLSVAYGYDFIHHQPLTNFRLVGLLNSSTYYAHANGIISIFFLTLLVFKFKNLSKLNKVLSIVAASLMLLGIYMTFTRGVWIGLSISALCLLWFEHRKFFIVLAIAGAILTTTLYNVSNNFRERVGQSTDTQASDEFRLNLLKLHLMLFKKSPLVGIGQVNTMSHTPPETWEKYGFSSKDTINTHAHNQFINTLTTSGILGIIPFLLFYFWFFITNLKLVKKFKTAKLKNHHILAVACLMAQLEFMIANMTDIGFEYSKIRSLILMVWAIVFVLWKDKAKVSETV